MSSVFEQVTISFKDKDYTIPPDRVMGLIEVLESIIPVEDILDTKPPRAKIARAYSQAIRYAGGDVSQDEIYSEFFTGGLVAVRDAITALVMMMIPPEHLRNNTPAAGEDEKKKD
jgi:hypothetical protein